MSEFLKLFGIYNLKEEGRKWCVREFGEQYESEFVEKYEAINRGIPIGGFYETVVFLDMVNTIKRELEEKTIVHRIKKLFGISEQLRWKNEMIEPDSCCGNCLWFDGEDIFGYGFCDEKEVEVYCSNCCHKWKRNTEIDEVIE